MYVLESPKSQVMSNTVLTVCGPLLVAFWRQEFVESFAHASYVCNLMYFGWHSSHCIMYEMKLVPKPVSSKLARRL